MVTKSTSVVTSSILKRRTTPKTCSGTARQPHPISLNPFTFPLALLPSSAHVTVAMGTSDASLLDGADADGLLTHPHSVCRTAQGFSQLDHTVGHQNYLFRLLVWIHSFLFCRCYFSLVVDNTTQCHKICSGARILRNQISRHSDSL